MMSVKLLEERDLGHQYREGNEESEENGHIDSCESVLGRPNAVLCFYLLNTGKDNLLSFKLTEDILPSQRILETFFHL